MNWKAALLTVVALLLGLLSVFRSEETLKQVRASQPFKWQQWVYEMRWMKAHGTRVIQVSGALLLLLVFWLFSKQV